MHESYLTVFFTEMNRLFPNEWCVLHSYETLPYHSDSDVDMAFSGGDIHGLESLIIRVAKTTGWTVYQKLWYDVKTCFYYVLKKNDTDVFLALDFLMDNDGIGRYGFTTKMLTTESILFNTLFPIPNPEVSFCYKLVKRIEKQRSLDEDKSYLLAQYANSDATKINIFLQQQFGASGCTMVIEYLKGVISLNERNLDFLKSQRKKRTSSIGSSITYVFWETLRTFNRVFHPCGVQITVPTLERKELELFTGLLKEKVAILFRFIEFSEKKSYKSTFISMSGSTLLINVQSNFNGKNAIRYKWFSRVSITSSEIKSTNVDVPKLVEVYYKEILNVLHLRLPKTLTV